MYERLQIKPIFNIPYSPDTNPIESCFSLVKHHFTKARLQRLVNGLPFDIEQAIADAFAGVDGLYVRRCADRSLNILT